MKVPSSHRYSLLDKYPYTKVTDKKFSERHWDLKEN